jgi:putative transposase
MQIKKTRPHARDLRSGRFSQPGQTYLVTTVTQDRLPHFSHFECARAVVKTLRQQDAAGACETLAWLLMPDHLHWLFVLRDDDLSSLLARVKQASAREVNRITGDSGQALWQRGFHDHAAWHDDDVVALARYIVANPLRTGLVEHIGDYPFWDAVWL